MLLEVGEIGNAKKNHRRLRLVDFPSLRLLKVSIVIVMSQVIHPSRVHNLIPKTVGLVTITSYGFSEENSPRILDEV